MEEEYFAVVDEKDKIIGKETRRVCHSGSMQRHRCACIFVFYKDKLLIQKRSLAKDLYKGYFASSAAGHVDYGESYEQAAKRELKEELGLNLPLKFVLKFKSDNEFEKEFITLYQALLNNPDQIKIDSSETESIYFKTIDEIRQMIKEGQKFTPTFLKAFENYNK
jgi:isopentenyl-diphosphate delta-isomerase type 1